jgi:hypothetical protein
MKNSVNMNLVESKMAVVSCHTRASVYRSSRTPRALLAPPQARRGLVVSAAHNEDAAISRTLEFARKTAAAFAACVTICLQTPALGAEQIALRLPVSGNKEIAQVQEVMLETWSVVGDSFFDVNALVRVPVPTDSKPRSGRCVKAGKKLLCNAVASVQ